MTNAITTQVPLSLKLRKLAEERLRRHREAKLEEVRNNLSYHADWVKKATENLGKVDDEAAQEVAKWVEVQAKLKQGKVKFKTTSYSLSIEVPTTEKQLTKVYRAIGRLDGSKADKDIADAEKGIIKVSLRSVAYPNVTVVYKRKLRPTDKCKIVTIQPEPRTELLCPRNK